MNSNIEHLTQDLKKGITDLYGSRLRGLYVFGSYARGNVDAESDIDILVVLDQVQNPATEIDRTGYLVSDLSLRHGISISRVFLSERDWLEGSTVFLQNVREEAVAV